MNRMKTLMVAAGLLLANGAALPDDRQHLAPLAKASFVPCSLEICGGFAANVATLGLKMGQVTVTPNGLVRVRLHRLTIAGSTVIVPNKTLEVWLGSYTEGVFQGGPVNPLGTITTDAHGNFHGTVDTGGGVAFRFAPGTTVSAQFILNEPGFRSEFVTGFLVP